MFDTVASVGLAASALIADGHQAWADADDSLRIPLEPVQCLHLVSGHEARRSFPLDSVLYRGELPPNCTEIVFPGVHSDIGGGYPPFDQGRGKDPWGGYRAGFEGTANIKMKDFGIKMDLGPQSENVELILTVEGVRK